MMEDTRIEEVKKEEVRVEKDFEMNIMPMREIDPTQDGMGEGYPGDQNFDEAKKINWLLILLILAIIVQGIVIFKMKRNKSKEDFYE